MIDTLLLDVGGVLLYPVSGEWMLSGDFAQVLGTDFFATRLQDFRMARRNLEAMLPDAIAQQDDSQEVEILCRYYQVVLNDNMHLGLTAGQIERLAQMQALTDERYAFFSDIEPYLQRWSKQFKLGIVSDAPPSTRRILRRAGIEQYFAAPTYSFELGVMKPQPQIFTTALQRLHSTAAEAVFVDDMANKLIGAAQLGIDTIQMVRDMPAGFTRSAPWQGKRVHSFAQLDAMLQTLRGKA